MVWASLGFTAGPSGRSTVGVGHTGRGRGRTRTTAVPGRSLFGYAN
ncbi:hypothetical protein B005_4069 [Nocardiopsis alba ATCC BAA-2165]|uniref:Uncharacterized protein n=1 Tax=Nocardiopsis alba (strain ATCC BAA-2165 / BE74) TaxID=1205910 RepID=J7L1G9_NOCAA|nr:hypothetical protein B005_4069 [Nocardiopsis alba ATCC BAA-2165]